MNLIETFHLASEIRAHLNAQMLGTPAPTRRVLRRDVRIGKVYHPDIVVGCGISWLWMLPKNHPWNKIGLCAKHDEIFTEGKLTLAEVQAWWKEEAWKASPTLNLKLLYFLTLPVVQAWTEWRYVQLMQIRAAKSSPNENVFAVSVYLPVTKGFA